MAISNSDYLPIVGKTLSVAERTALQCSIPLLSSYHRVPVEFWGKVCGITSDYYIAQAVPDGFFGPRINFFCVDGGSTWTPLGDVSEEQAAFCDQLRGLFQGDPSYLYKIRQDLPAEPEPAVQVPEADDVLSAAKAEVEAAQGNTEERQDDDNEEEGEHEEDDQEEGDEQEEDEPEEEEGEEVPAARRSKPKFTIISLPERTRVAHFVELHDAACRLFLRGEYILSGGKAGELNRGFAGHAVQHAMKPSCYMKAAHAGFAERNKILYGPTYNIHTDYWMPITEDIPQGVWTVKYDPTLNVVAVENLLFRGSLFWYRPGTTRHGQVYYGNGERNFEICSLL